MVSAAGSAASPADGRTGNVDRGDELSEGESSAQDYRTRVEEAQLPDDVREAALFEVDKLERTTAQSAECREIRTWLNAILDLPWSSKVTQSIDIQGSREVEATLRRLIEPTVADVNMDDTVELKPLALDGEKGDTADAVPALADVQERDTVQLERLALDVEEPDAAGVEPAAVDAEERDTVQLERLALDVDERDTAEVEPLAVEADAAGVEPSAAVDVDETDSAEIEPLAVDVEQGNAAEVERSAVDDAQADATEAELPAVDAEEDAAEVEPSAVADGVQLATEAEPLAADLEKDDAAAGDRQHDDPVKMPGAAAVLSGDQLPRPHVVEKQVLEPKPVQTPKRKGFGYVAVAVTAVAALLVGALLFAVSRDRGGAAQSVPTATAPATANNPTSGPSNGSTNTAGKEPTIQLENFPETARSFQTVRLEGTYRSGPDTFVQVQRLEGGQWLDFPLPAKTDKAGRFTTFIELGQPGRYRLRVVDPHSGVRSKTYVLVITG